MYNQKYSLEFGPLDRPRNESKLVMPVKINAQTDAGPIQLVYLITGENLDEINAALSTIHASISEYLNTYFSTNFKDEPQSNNKIADDVLVELGLQIDEAFKKTGNEDAKYLVTCTDDDQAQLDSLCIELGIDPIRIPDGMSKLVFWIMKNALKKVAVKAKES